MTKLSIAGAEKITGSLMAMIEIGKKWWIWNNA